MVYTWQELSIRSRSDGYYTAYLGEHISDAKK